MGNGSFNFLGLLILLFVIGEIVQLCRKVKRIRKRRQYKKSATRSTPKQDTQTDFPKFDAIRANQGRNKSATKQHKEYTQKKRKSVQHKKYKKNNFNKNATIPQVSREEKGAIGEKKAEIELSMLPGKKEIFRNCYFFREDGTTSEIDVILLHEKGIYVIESKNFSGWIFGREKDLKWTQSLFNGKETVKNQFYNPIMQNKTHLAVIRQCLQPAEGIPVKSYIVFGRDADLKSIEYNESAVRVVSTDKLHGRIVSELLDSVSVISEEEFSRLSVLLKESTQVDEETRRKHIENIQRNVRPDLNKAPAAGITEVPEAAEIKETGEEEIKESPEVAETKEAQIVSTFSAVPVFSAPDEIKKFKELLDCGAITQEEYEAKKKQLLGL